MLKTLDAANRSERRPFFIPRSVQQTIPIQRIYKDGIWQVNGKLTQTWRFADVNYALASPEDQEDMFRAYCGVLNALPTDAAIKITINNRRLNSTDFHRTVLMKERPDALNSYRREYNAVLVEKAAESNNLVQDKYITVAVAKKSVEECLRSETARLMFANSEFLILLNQAATDRAELAKLLNISQSQMGHITNAPAGHGLLRVGGSIVPFANDFPRDGELYRPWSTTPGDK